jgi:hypothetical protein
VGVRRVKNVLVSLPYGMAVRNLVCCGVIEACVKKSLNVTVLAPHLTESDHKILLGELPEGVAVERLLAVPRSWLYSYLKFLKQYFYSKRTGLESFQIRRRYRRRKTPFFHAAARLVEGISEWTLTESQVDRLLGTVPQPNERHYHRLIERTGADGLVITKPGYMPEDLPVIKAARVAGMPIISVDTTWDNMVAKRPPYILPDALTVWNGRMRQEAIAYYGFRDSSALVTGGSQFDIFFDEMEPFPSRAALLTSMGLDPARRLIVFTLNNPVVMTPDNGAYVRLILERISSGAISGSPNLVVRIHPWDRDNDYRSDVAGFPRVYVQKPFGHSGADSVFECLPTRRDVVAYGALMRHADVLINIASTTSLDALATDTPIVNIAFDITPNPPETSCARFYGYSHYKPIVDAGCVRVAASEVELCRLLNAYLEDRTLDRDVRRAARDSFLTFADATSARRMSEAIASVAR